MEQQDPRLILYVLALVFTACGQTAFFVWKLVGIRDAILGYVNKIRAELEKALDEKADKMMAAATLGRVDVLEDRVIRVESEMRHLPDKGETHRLEMTLAGLRSDVATLTERMKPIAAIADRVQETLLENIKR